MALAFARRIGKIGGFLHAATPSLQITANYARYQRKTVRRIISDHPTYLVGGLYEPDYLDKLQPPIDQYSILDIDIEGYDFPVLEKYQSYLYKQIRDLDLEYLDSYGHPNQVIDAELYKPKSEIVQEVYNLRSFKRTIQIGDVPVTMVGLLIDVLHATAPPGVTFTVVPHDEQREQSRYVPDIDIAETKRELENLLAPK